MAVIETNLKSLFLDKTEIQRVVVEQNEKSGFVPDPTATPEKAQTLIGANLRARGLLPEDNLFSQGIIEAREDN